MDPHRLLLALRLSFVATLATSLAAFTNGQTPLTVNKPDWPLEVLSWDIDKAYPGVEYNHRLAVRGGVYPYTFHLIAGPAGMVIDARTGEIRWTPAAEVPAQTVSISIVDSRNASLTHSFAVASERGAFRFVAPNGTTSNNGSEASPWPSLAYASAHAGVSNYIYVKAGTYRDTFTINASVCGRFLAWPGDSVTIIGNGTTIASIGIASGERFIFQGFTFDANDLRWLFNCEGGILQNVIWRKNTMHNAYSNDRENPAFIFFKGGGQKPINGQIHYKNIVMQENVFHDLRNPYGHGASTTLYDVQDLLYEDNHAYDIDGRGVSDKDDGYRNTFRNNTLHDCDIGLGLFNQSTQAYIEVDHNLIYNCVDAVWLGGQPGYLKDVFFHHNTILGRLQFLSILDEPESININIYANIVSAESLPYTVSPRKISDAGGGSHYEYPLWFQTGDSKMKIDGNLIWTTASAVAGSGASIPLTAWPQWQAHGYDVNGLLADPALVINYALPPNSPYLGIYGRDLPSPASSTFTVWRTANFTAAEQANTAISGPEADPDACGLSNLARYAFGLPARGPVANPITPGTTTINTASYLTLAFPRRTDATDLRYIVESSTDLATWTAVPGQTYTAGSGPITAQDAVAIGATPRRFLRLRITQQ
jgi:hypothetical protein